jgi:primary-amine oxidase
MAALLAGQRGSTSVEPDGGLPDYIQSERNLVDADVVLWYTFGINHVVRPEDWPVMPVHLIGFKLIPSGFFAGNPALDNPAPSRCHHHG